MIKAIFATLLKGCLLCCVLLSKSYLANLAVEREDNWLIAQRTVSPD